MLDRFGLIPFRSPLLREFRNQKVYGLTHALACVPSTYIPISILVSFPPGTKMFQFPGSRIPESSSRIISNTDWVSPFGHLRIKGCLAPPRSVSPPNCVLHRHTKPRHPPCTLISPVRRSVNHNLLLTLKETSSFRGFLLRYCISKHSFSADRLKAENTQPLAGIFTFHLHPQ